MEKELVVVPKWASHSVHLHPLGKLDHDRGAVVRLCLEVPLELLCEVSLELLSLGPQGCINSTTAAAGEKHLETRGQKSARTQPWHKLGSSPL